MLDLAVKCTIGRHLEN